MLSVLATLPATSILHLSLLVALRRCARCTYSWPAENDGRLDQDREQAVMPARTDPQLCLDFARPKRSKGGLEIDSYQELVQRLRSDAHRVAERFKLPGFDLDSDRPNSRTRYGICFSDGRIRVRLVNVRTGHTLKYSALIDTVVHELAHLRYMNHGPRWESLYQRMLKWAREQGIYEPREIAPTPDQSSRPAASTHVRQLRLFDNHG
jgi:hypothetical protein